ncbi:MAG: RNA polymerase sigma factor [Kouleothrix sp.]
MPLNCLYQCIKNEYLATAYRLMGNRQDAEDQAQEVFLKIYRGIRQLEDPGMFTLWVYRITTNTCFDALSKQKRRPQTTPLDPPDENGNEEPRYADAQTLGRNKPRCAARCGIVLSRLYANSMRRGARH